MRHAMVAVALGALAVTGVESAPEHGRAQSAVETVAKLRSVTYYRFPTKLQDLDLNLLGRDLIRAKDVGFNGMWFVVCWRDLSPVALPEPTLNEAAWGKLDAIVERVSQGGFSLILPLGYFGRGWSPQGITDDRVATWILDDEIWGAFEDHAVRFARRYADRSNILWMFYTESFQGPLKAYNDSDLAKASFRAYCRQTNPDIAHWNERWASDYHSFDDIGMADGRHKRGATRWEDHFRWVCSVLRDRYGGLTRELKDDVGVRGLVGFHDNAMITKDWAKGDTPIPEDNPYDYLSFTAYYGKGDMDERLREVEQVRGRFASRYPDVPLLLGETGAASLVTGEQAQAKYLGAMARLAHAKSLGLNIWMWQDFEGSTPEQRSFGLLRMDGSEKPVVDSLRQHFRQGKGIDSTKPK